MSKQLSFIIYGIMLISLSYGQVLSSESLSVCTCSQLMSEKDCGMQSVCQWNAQTKICQNYQQLPEKETYYCDQFEKSFTLCANAFPCAWSGTTCGYFTTCTAYVYDTDEKCQTISKRCFSDGVHCNEYGECYTYNTQNSCLKNSNNKFCYWNNENINNPKCELADQCSKLPKSLNSDAQCREQLNECTVSASGGCVISGVNCQDQVSELSCFSNKDRTQNCFWNEGKCMDKICDNASKLFITDKACSDFLKTCTTKQGGGCVTRSNCSVAIQAACIKDINENDCFWNGQGCFNKTCSNALKQYNSNLLCQQYLKTCITTGSGCVENTGCEAAIISDACEKTIDGQICHWDGKACKLKTCENAGSNYVGHDQCTQYMSSCTAKLPNGCQNRQCDNAPVSNNTNDLCKSYLINGNCITKLNGGCKINTNCESIDIDIACVQDINGQQCFWNDGKCLTKICSNSPTTNNTHQLCQDFLSSCTVGPNNNCVEKTCENIQQVENCISDFNSKPCNIKTKCYKKYCSLASKNITTHQECQQYLSNCTLDNSGYGCMDIPKLCQGISNIKSCIINADNKGCAWSENKCVDRQCNFADQTFTTTDACNTYKTGCVVNNNLKGCIQLPIKCSDRKQKENCEIEAQPKCQWDNVSNIENPICIDIKCENAHLISLKDVVSINGCWNYYSLNCGMTIINETKVCIPRPTICNGLIQLTCQKVDILVGDQSCYWDDIAKLCKPQQCASITFQISNSITHSDCNNNINKCTVNQDQSGCVDLKECNLYTTQKQCVIDQNKKECFWDGQKCNYSPCSSADDSDSFKTQIQCDGFSNQCTLNQTKCSLKKTNCSEYKNQGACETNTLNKQIQCVWEDNSCKTSEGDFDCTQIKGEGLTYGYCSSINFYCSVNAAGTSCIESKNCSDYEQENCSRDYIGRQCIYFAEYNYCDVDCLFAPGPFTDDYCFEYSESCTITVDGSKCVNYLDYCDSMELANCTYSFNDEQCLIKNGQCVSAENNALVSATCESYKQPYLGLNYCMGISKNFNSCSVNSLNNSCVKMEVHCSTYNSKEKCYFSIQDGDCFWSEVQAQCLLFTAQKCSEYKGTSVQECKSKDQSCTWITGQTTCSQNCPSAAGPFDLDICLDYGFACNVKLDAAGCVDQVDTCANTNKSNCQLSQEGFCYLKEDVCTLASSDYLANDKCETITGVNLTAYYCLNISQNNCSANSLQNKCVRSEEECYQYQVENCHESYNYVKCVISEDGTECMDFQYLPCSKIKIYGLTIYTNYHCQQFRASCQSRQDQTGCEDKIICSDKKGSNLSYMTCLDYSVKCSVNSEQTQCVNAKKTCSEYSVTECGYSLNEGECMVSNNLCIQKSCDLYDSSIKNMSDCQSLSQNCVIRVGGCQDGQCSSYTIQQQCTTDYQNKNCLWNPTAKKCVDSTCQAAENTTFFDTHLECQKAGDCTVKANNKTLSFGCIPLVACNLYVIKEQCVVDNNNVKCIWNDIDELNQSCGYKSCSTAPLGINTSIDCFNYLNGCTVNLIDVNGLLTLQGCTPLKKCKDYQKDQCYKSIDKNQNNEYIDCGWNGQVCDDKSCLTADNSYNTHILCSQYFQGCTVNNTNDGCITIPETCEIMTEQQCYINSTDKNNNQCIWIAETNKCETKTCENSPNYANEAECNAHLKDCSLDSIKCKTKVCEDFNFTTDDECKNALSQNQCSSNGITCVSRGFCEQAQAEIGCTFDSQGKLCQWMPAGYCTLRNCSTAPNTLITEEQCQQYYKPTNQSSCTTKKNGGCTIKSQCNVANVQAACTTDNAGAKCQWDTDKCRLQECIDFKGSTHYECNKIRSNCTVGLNGKCAQMQNCENTTIQQACIIGNNGTCLWISKYINNDGTLGACFQYDSCQSMKWKTHEQCQIISPNCTTNGESCIGITNCNETNINGGCHIGTDGQCIQTVLAKQSKDVICKKYQNCESAYYLTHQECNMSNPNCTSDYKIGCISLDSCSSFSLQEQCHINKDGTIKDKEGAIISTGNCVWDSASGKGCRDEQCMDIVLTTEKECSQKLKYCSTNGTTCITKQKCDQYIDENACKNAGGIDGSVCIWSAGTGTIAASCRIKLCTDIQNGSTNQACSIVPNCVTDGVNCVKMTVCSEYTTKVACMQKGTSGFCFWTEPLPSEKQGKCELMTSCKYGNDEFTCNQVNDRCEWNSNTLQCSSYTCQSYQKKTNKCQYYPSWNLSTYTICSINNGNCIETDPQKLSENDCYVQSTYRYYWDTAKSKCSVCQNSNQVNSTNNTANNSNNVDASSILMKIVVYSILISV